MDRFWEIIEELKARIPHDPNFLRAEQYFRNEHLPNAIRELEAYDRAFQLLDEPSWSILKSKAIDHFSNGRQGQVLQGFFNQLNEAFAYEFLVSKGFSSVKILPEGRRKSPDLEYMNSGETQYCEVKSVGRSEEDIRRFEAVGGFDGSVYYSIDSGLFSKFRADIEQGRKQIEAVSGRGLVFVQIKFDDVTLTYVETYRRQLREFLRDQSDVVFKGASNNCRFGLINT